MASQGKAHVDVQHGHPEERDACAVVATIRSSGESTHGNLKRTLEALAKMGHRSGDVHSEGDGCGVLTDIPRLLWMKALEQVGRPIWLAEDKRFFVGHLMIPASERPHLSTWQAKVLRILAGRGADLLLERRGLTRREALGRLAQRQEPYFWQVAGILSNSPLSQVERTLFEMSQAIEAQSPIHVASLSNHSVVYKVRGSVETLYHYYPELRNRDYTTAITIGHARYSTNTTTAFERVQPFTLLGHNGEINTIQRLREQMKMLGTNPVEGGSDSQDLNRLVETLIHNYGFTVIEALEIVFPLIPSEVMRLPESQRVVYEYYRRAFGPYAQGPAAVVARHGDICVGSVDALGLRPLWFGQTDKECFFSSEKGVVPLDLLNGDPKPLAPGEKIAVRLKRDKGIEILEYPEIQRHVVQRAEGRFGSTSTLASIAISSLDTLGDEDRESQSSRLRLHPITNATRAAFGWSRDDVTWAQDIAKLGKDPIASLGFDGPLAALSAHVQNLSDYFKEKVAVVTNPAIDREREQEHFSTRVVIGSRPPLEPSEIYEVTGRTSLTLEVPILLGGQPERSPIAHQVARKVALRHGTVCLEDLPKIFPAEEIAWFSLETRAKEPTRLAVQRLVRAVRQAVEHGAKIIILTDGEPFIADKRWIPPELAIATLDRTLRETSEPAFGAPNWRREVSLIVHSAAIRNLHDMVVMLGLGADAVVPWLLLATAVSSSGPDPDDDTTHKRLDAAVTALAAGIEKVTSTMGIHELRGYGRTFSAIGLSNELVDQLEIPNFCGGSERGVTWEALDRDAQKRSEILSSDKVRPPRIPRFYPHISKALRQLVEGKGELSEVLEQIRAVERQLPVALRHVIGFSFPATPVKLQPENIDTSITGHSLPFVISSMSFGSQSETAFRAYAEAAYRLNILALNGEGGEIQEIMGRYPFNRGQQIASGRFGVNIDLLNASNLLEIKIGQGAKPGEGGHLPGRKVSSKVARARHVSPGIDLISPSNNHDIYSIEDLAQFIEELKTANPKARVAVKLPVVPDIGLISVGVAKAGADIIELTGYDGGTGAARAHSIRHVGLPVEIGIVEAHRALLASHMRSRVELWADGGVRSPDDVVKLMCLGANRIGFGTLAMIAVGCLLCRSCHFGTCRVGITTQIETPEEAEANNVKQFTPMALEEAINGLINLFNAFGEATRQIAARLGCAHLQDLVGRTDLLEQTSHFEQLNLQDLLTPAATVIGYQDRSPGLIPLRRPRNHLTTVVSNLIMETLAAGESRIAFEDGRVTPVDRALGTHLAGALRRYQHDWNWGPGHEGIGGHPESWRQPTNGSNERKEAEEIVLRFYASSVPGNGLGAFSCEPIKIVVEGGAQDGVGKGLYGGRIVVLKGYNHEGMRIDGSVGKGLGYGAIKGTIIVQGNADSRACIRLSGADVIIGGEITQPLNDNLGLIAARANVKGFLCEYMTAGRVLVLGDPGPWICAGMTGGVLYLHLQPEMNFDMAAIRRRIAGGADVVLLPVAPEDGNDLEELIMLYASELEANHQPAQSEQVRSLLDDWDRKFAKIVPRRYAQQASSAIADADT